MTTDHSSSPAETPLRSSDFLTDVVIGMSDGLTIPFALAAGLSGVVSNSSIIVITGLVAVAAGSVTMGLGGYLAGKAAHDHYQATLQKGNAAVDPAKEQEDVKDFFANIGLSEEIQQQAAEELTNDKKQWVDFMKKYELGPEKSGSSSAIKSALNIGISYAIGGLVPLSPFFFSALPSEALKIAAIITLTSLFIFGFFRSRIAGINPWKGALRATIFGALAAGAAFGVARLFGE